MLLKSQTKKQHKVDRNTDILREIVKTICTCLSKNVFFHDLLSKTEEKVHRNTKMLTGNCPKVVKKSTKNQPEY